MTPMVPPVSATARICSSSTFRQCGCTPATPGWVTVSGWELAQVAHDREVGRTLRKACPEPSQVPHQRAGTAICPPQGIGGDHPSSAAYLRFTNTREVDLAVEAAAKNSVPVPAGELITE